MFVINHSTFMLCLSLVVAVVSVVVGGGWWLVSGGWWVAGDGNPLEPNPRALNAAKAAQVARYDHFL